MGFTVREERDPKAAYTLTVIRLSSMVFRKPFVVLNFDF